jgi:hypothetical protein
MSQSRPGSRMMRISGSTMVGTAGFFQGYFGSVIELIYSGGGQFITVYQNGSFSGH